MIRSIVSALAAAACVAAAAIVSPAPPCAAQQLDVQEFTLDNGMKFLLYPRTEEPNIIAAGWLAKVGSVNERPGITGISHFFEHMMFKGTNTIGTKDAAKDKEFRAKQKAVRDELMKLQLGEQYKRYKAGEIDDPWNPANDTPKMRELRGELAKLMREQLDITQKNEFDRVYTSMGASGMNAFTSEDVTFYFINVPANKFELWAWMESDRLTNSVFREFYAERDVVHEERRLRTESTPTGVFQEQFEAMFWMSSPYHWPVIGWTSDLNSYTMEQAADYYDIYYRPNNLVGVIVGDFRPEEIKPLISRYFSRLERGPREVPPVVTLEMPQMAEQRMNAEGDFQPQIEVRYKAVPFRHADSYPLEVMAQVLNGRTGRLYKTMIDGKKIASSARASLDIRKYGGAFSFEAETKGEASPADLENAWYEELARLQKEPVPEQELQKVKNQFAANTYRRLTSNFFIMVQLGMAENMGGWQELNDGPRKIQAVTAADVQRVANRYFDRKNRSVATYVRASGTDSKEDPELAKLGETMGPMVKQGIKRQLAQLAKETDAGKLRQGLAQMEERKAQAPAQMQPVLEYMAKKVQERIAELEKSGKGGGQ
ncbi:MAG: insulinase family protein [Phycisphaerales bacterium]|nr:insulinase family protein [Phycisphaerales bacterium]